jgi:hypothetical protein
MNARDDVEHHEEEPPEKQELPSAAEGDKVFNFAQLLLQLEHSQKTRKPHEPILGHVQVFVRKCTQQIEEEMPSKVSYRTPLRVHNLLRVDHEREIEVQNEIQRQSRVRDGVNRLGHPRWLLPQGKRHLHGDHEPAITQVYQQHQ